MVDRNGRKKRFTSGIDWKDIYIYIYDLLGLDLENLYFLKVCFKKYAWMVL